jgi:transposase
VDPELMIRMLIVGYRLAIRWERRLCEEVHLNPAYRWFCRLGRQDAVPEHATFCHNRTLALKQESPAPERLLLLEADEGALRWLPKS